MAWNAYISVKSNDKFPEADWSKWKKDSNVEKIWSTSGEWDWWVELKADASQPDQVEKWIKEFRKSPWVKQTETYWWKEV